MQKQRLRAGAQLPHSHQPLAVRAKPKSSPIARQIVALTGIKKKTMPMIGVEGPELEKQTPFIFPLFVILIYPHLLIGGYEDGGLLVQFETGPGAISVGRCHGGECKYKCL